MKLRERLASLFRLLKSFLFTLFDKGAAGSSNAIILPTS